MMAEAAGNGPDESKEAYILTQAQTGNGRPAAACHGYEAHDRILRLLGGPFDS